MNFTPEQIKVIEWAAAECERQQTGPMAVANMMQAVAISLRDRSEPLYGAYFYHVIFVIGRAVEPIKNKNGLRNTPVRFANGTLLSTKEDTICRQLYKLCEQDMMGDVTPEQFYQEFQEIHPFIDGNGRTGAILYWMLKCRQAGILVPPPVPPLFQPR